MLKSGKKKGAGRPDPREVKGSLAHAEAMDLARDELDAKLIEALENGSAAPWAEEDRRALQRRHAAPLPGGGHVLRLRPGLGRDPGHRRRTPGDVLEAAGRGCRLPSSLLSTGGST